MQMLTKQSVGQTLVFLLFAIAEGFGLEFELPNFWPIAWLLLALASSGLMRRMNWGKESAAFFSLRWVCAALTTLPLMLRNVLGPDACRELSAASGALLAPCVFPALLCMLRPQRGDGRTEAKTDGQR